ncbi:peptide chain release factor 2 [bacterium]|nr:peptide chain release factor 2 [bacterium]
MNRDDLRDLGSEIAVLFSRIENTLKPQNLKEQQLALEAKLADPAVWEDRKLSVKLQQEKAALQRQLDHMDNLHTEMMSVQDDIALLEMGEDPDHLPAAMIRAKRLLKTLNLLEVESLFSKEEDAPAIVTIHAGAGGVDAQDWADMLRRMYLRWAKAQSLAAKEIDASPGSEAGILSATLVISGPWATGWMNAEAGVHRLVRISPFDSAGRRHTSFAYVEITPQSPDATEEALDLADIHMDFFRAGGPGGQHANKTSSAVRLVHKPTGLTVTARNERSQHQNRATAMAILQSRLHQLRQDEEEGRRKEGARVEIAWGNQVRSYVLHPYQLVKDSRSGFETGRVEDLLDGNLSEIMRSVLLARREE